MHKRRLLKLADLLEANAGNKTGAKFDMSTFGDVTDADNPISCGTTVCAMGLAALSGAFKRTGLTAKVDREHLPCFNVNFYWKGRETSPFVAAQRTFEITREDAKALFDGSLPLPNNGHGAKAERAMAKVLRTFAKTGEIPV